MINYYNELMKIKGSSDLKVLVNRWKILSENLSKAPTQVPVLLPDILLVANSGAGRSNLVRLISEFLAKCPGLMEFQGDVKFFEISLSYASPDHEFKELQRLTDAIVNAAGFRSQYKGIVHIDIDDWRGHFSEKHFINFLDYLSNNSDKLLLMLSVSSMDKQKLGELEAILTTYLRIEKVTLPLPKTEDLFEYIENFLARYDLKLDESGKELLFESIEVLRKNRYFDGFKSIKMLCQDIVYSFFANPEIRNRVLDRQLLADFSADSNYIKRAVLKIEKINKIGFGN